MKKPYHHGDLYISLLESATELIAEGGIENLSIRKLADRAGVSRTAPYHHFKDKNALLCAIAERGFQQQDQLLEAAVADRSRPLAERFEAYVISYLKFATEMPETYDLMYGRNIWKTGTPTESLQHISKGSFKLWLSWIEALQQHQLLDQSPTSLRLAQSTWAALHGLCRLFNDGVYVDRSDFEAIAKTSLCMMLQGQSSE